MERSDLNKMSAQNLAVVFGPNLVWSKDVAISLVSIVPINMFVQFLLQHQNEIFIIWMRLYARCVWEIKNADIIM